MLILLELLSCLVKTESDPPSEMYRLRIDLGLWTMWLALEEAELRLRPKVGGPGCLLSLKKLNYINVTLNCKATVLFSNLPSGVQCKSTDNGGMSFLLQNAG